MTKVIRTMMHIIQTGQYNQQILQHLESAWEDLQPPSPSMLERIMVFVTSPQASDHKVADFNKIAEYMVSTMNLHLLNMLAIFQENAELEGIRTQERDEILNEAQPEIIRIMEEIDGRLSIQSLDDLATLVNITTGLEMLSETDSADSAQNWLYELPVLYHDRLQEEGLLRDEPASVISSAWVIRASRLVHGLLSHRHKDSKFSTIGESHTAT